MHVETVAWITGRNESIYAVFYLGCFLAYARWRETNRRSAYLAAVFLCVAALWSKQSALTLPILLVSFDRLVTRSFAGWRAYAPFGTATLVHLVIRYWAFHQAVNEERTWLWAFALPCALQAPYQTEDLTRRLHVIWTRASIVVFRASGTREPSQIWRTGTAGRTDW